MKASDEALRRLAAALRTPLAETPTPLRPAPNLRASLGAGSPEIWIKHDDLTGFGLGGNKVRKLEHELAPDRIDGVTHVITVGGPQSNHCRVTAAAAARLGLGCVLVISGEPGEPPRGNALLHRLLGARLLPVRSRAARLPRAEEAAREIEEQGGRALVVPLGASTGTGALGYARAAVELNGQLEKRRLAGRRIHVVLASSSGGTLAGLALGFTLLGRDDVRLLGVSADVPAEELRRDTERLALRAWDRLEVGGDLGLLPDLLATTDLEVGGGYAVPTPASEDALRRFARTEGVVLDPTYTAKAAAGLVRAARDGVFADDDLVVFLHTGGHPTLLA